MGGTLWYEDTHPREWCFRFLGDFYFGWPIVRISTVVRIDGLEFGTIGISRLDYGVVGHLFGLGRKYCDSGAFYNRGSSTFRPILFRADGGLLN